MFMDLPTLQTQSSTTDTNASPYSQTQTTAPNGTLLDEATPQQVADTPAQRIDPNAIILAEVLTDKTINWQIHNCKITKKTVTKDLPLPFLYHYDGLDESVKKTHPLTPALLTQFNTPMSAQEAARRIGIDDALITRPWHVKLTGSLVVFSDVLQLAVRLHWTNTGKETQQIYTKDETEALSIAIKDWQFFGRVDVLYKNPKQTLISCNVQPSSTQTPLADSLLLLEASRDYQQLPAAHALTIIAQLDADKADLPWFDSAILARVQ